MDDLALAQACSSVPQHWVVCAVCSVAMAFIGIKNGCYYILADLVDMDEDYKYTWSPGCPFLFDDTIWKHNLTFPLKLPYTLREVPRVMRKADGAYWAGMAATAVPAGLIADRGYSKHMLVGAIVALLVCHFCIDFVSVLNAQWYVAQRLVEGGLDAIVVCSIFNIISGWAKPPVRNLYTALVVSGMFYGNALAHLLYRLAYVGLGDWWQGQAVTGMVGLAWLWFGHTFVYHFPSVSPIFIQNTYQNDVIYPFDAHYFTSASLDNPITPWRKIFFSPSFISAVLVFCSLSWGVLVNIKSTYVGYERHVLRLPERFSYTSTAISIAVVPSSLMAGFMADTLAERGLMSKTAVKKVFVFIGVILPSLLQGVAVHVGCDVVLFWVLSTISTYIIGFAIPVVFSTPIHLSPYNAGLLMGVMVVAASLCEALHVFVRNSFLHENIVGANIKLLVVLQCVFSCVLAAPFLVFGSGEVQYWVRDVSRE